MIAPRCPSYCNCFVICAALSCISYVFSDRLGPFPSWVLDLGTILAFWPRQTLSKIVFAMQNPRNAELRVLARRVTMASRFVNFLIDAGAAAIFASDSLGFGVFFPTEKWLGNLERGIC